MNFNVLHSCWKQGGDASTRHLASVQDPAMALLKSETPTLSTLSLFPEMDAAAVVPTLMRGRNSYSSYAVLRTKPGRADSPPSHSMSCSDKIALWNYVGVQGALGAALLDEPLYIDTVIVGMGDEGAEERPEGLKEDCERAFWRRIKSIPGMWNVCKYSCSCFMLTRNRQILVRTRYINPKLCLQRSIFCGPRLL